MKLRLIARPAHLAATTLALLCAFGGAHAETLLNQQGALAGGAGSASDAPGFPITISAPGSYKLTSDLVVDDPTKAAIEILVTTATIDLNGHSIRGPVTCQIGASGAPTYCTGDVGAPGAWGIIGPATSIVTSYTIRNGRIRGFGRGGISLSSVRVEDVDIFATAGHGIVAADASLLRVHSFDNLGWGVVLSGYGSVVDSRATANAQGGMYLKPTVVKRNNLVVNNTYNSIFGGSAAGSSGNVCNGVAC